MNVAKVKPAELEKESKIQSQKYRYIDIFDIEKL